MDDSGNTGTGQGQFFEKKYLSVMIYDHLSCPLRHNLEMQGFSYFLGLFQVIMANPVIDSKS